MFNKISLTEKCVFIDKLPKILPVNLEKVSLNIIENFFYKNIQNNSEVSYLNQYYHLDDDKNIQWIIDYIRDHFRFKFNKTPLLTHRAGILQPQGEAINYHNHIDEFDLSNSPDLSALITLKSGDQLNFVNFNYDDGRKKNQNHKVYLEKGKIILFNSHINHFLSKNFNTDPVINLSLKFQLV